MGMTIVVSHSNHRLTVVMSVQAQIWVFLVKIPNCLGMISCRKEDSSVLNTRRINRQARNLNLPRDPHLSLHPVLRRSLWQCSPLLRRHPSSCHRPSLLRLQLLPRVHLLLVRAPRSCCLVRWRGIVTLVRDRLRHLTLVQDHLCRCHPWPLL